MDGIRFKPITREEAATILSVSLRAIDHYVAVGILPAPISLGGRRKYWLPDVFYSSVRERLTSSAPSMTHLPTEQPVRVSSPVVRSRRRRSRIDSGSDRARSKTKSRLRKLNRR